MPLPPAKDSPCSFWKKNWLNSMLAHPPPSSGKSGSATDLTYEFHPFIGNQIAHKCTQNCKFLIITYAIVRETRQYMLYLLTSYALIYPNGVNTAQLHPRNQIPYCIYQLIGWLTRQHLCRLQTPT